MKTKYIILSLAAALFMSACAPEADHYLEGLRLSSSYITLPLEGGSKTITIDADADWTFDFDIEVDTTYTDPVKGSKTEKITRNQLTQFYEKDEKNGLSQKTGKDTCTIWLTISPVSGGKGKTDVTFTTIKRDSEKSVNVYLKSGDKKQTIVVSRVATETAELPVSTVKEITEGPDGRVYRAKGYCTKITGTYYGNWYLSDATVDGSSVKQLYIYGTVDATGSYNWSSFNIAVGDVVTVEGPKSTYNGTVELVDASVIKVEKALMIADETTKTIDESATPFDLSFTQNGETFVYESKAAWLSLSKDYDLVNGKCTVKVTPEANTTGKNREGELWFKSTKMGTDKNGNPKKDSTEGTVVITQLATTQAGTLLTIRNLITPGTKNAKVNFDVTLTDTATVTFVDGSNIFLEDKAAGLYVSSSDVKLYVGQKVCGRLFGQGYSNYSMPTASIFNISAATVLAAPKLSADMPKPAKVTLAELSTNWNDYFCRYIEVDNVAVTDTVAATFESVVVDADGNNVVEQNKGTWQYKKTTGDRKGKIADDADGTNELEVYVQCKKYLDMKKDKRYNVIGTTGVNNSTKQINIWDPSQVKEVKP